MENRLMTIVFLDMQGYTKRSAQQTIEEMKLFHDQMFKFVSDIVERWNGIMVKTMGDGFMVRFDSPTNAVQAGIEIQKKLEARNAQMMNPDSIVRFRVGINSGEVGIDENGDLFGDPVNIAARIQTFADTNDVFISEATYLAMNRNEFGAVDLGSQDLKNATREIRIYKVLKNGSPGLINHKPHPEKKAEQSKRSFLIPVVALVVVLSLVIGFVVGRKKANRNQSHENHVVANNQADKGNSDGGNPAEESNTTILDLKANDPRLKFTSSESSAFSELLKKRSARDFSNAEGICINMINTQPGPKKLPWGLMLTELFFEQGKKSEAEQMCKNLLTKAPLVPEVKNRLTTQLDKLRKKYP